VGPSGDGSEDGNLGESPGIGDRVPGRIRVRRNWGVRGGAVALLCRGGKRNVPMSRAGGKREKGRGERGISSFVMSLFFLL
jgi:hypothetical protein